MEKKAIQFDREVRLGEGGYGSVFPGTFQGRKVAVKRVLLIDAPSSDHDGKVLQQLNHPNIVKRLHFETDDNFK
jgi:serine/threonine protein kinase